MIVVKEEQGGDWARLDPIVEGGGSDFSRSTTMLKEDQQQQQSDLRNNNNNNSNSLNHNVDSHHSRNGPNPVGHGTQMSGTPNGICGGVSNNLCCGCGQRIFDRYYVLAVESSWHNDCLKCQHCGVVLSNQLTCFARDGLILCKEDYYRTYQQIPRPRRACARCRNGIGSQELIMRAKDLVYHLNCFVCVVCLRILNKGDHFGMRNSDLYCQKHYEMALDENSGSSPPPNLHPNSPHHHSHGLQHHSPIPNHLHHPSTTFFNGAGSGQKGRPRKRKDPTTPTLVPVMELGATTPPGMPHLCQNLELLGNDPNNVHLSGPRLEGYDSSSSTNCAGGVGQQRTKRMRTSFKHHQLRTMKSYFAINQNPDAKDLKQLAQKTGLSKRVLQVWFQNARAKWRRNSLRNETKGGVSPNREDELQMNPNSMTPGALDMLSTGGGSEDGDGGFSSDVY